jgi:AraC family carnitine catabolism transcriptional activator
MPKAKKDFQKGLKKKRVPVSSETELEAFALDCGLNLDEMARRWKMSRRSMQRAFNAELNLSPKQWKDLFRARRSADEIAGGGLAKVVSANQGFKHLSNFSNFMRRVLKTSPRDCRRA